jgi:hypothetical protein
MADVDLNSGGAQRIRQAYQTYLQRDAGDHEVTGWLSGSYGGGGEDDWIRQIQNSDEARQKQASNTPPPPNGTVVGQTPNTNGPQDGGQQQTSGGGQQTGAPPAYSQEQIDQINKWYQEYLGRGAAADEQNNWLSGAYGWGDANNAAGIQRGIAANRTTKPTNTGAGEGTRGTSSQSNFNTTANQPPAGWSNNEWYGAVQSIVSAYKSYLGREPSDDEVVSWLTGKYGYGNTPGAVTSMLDAIRNSAEAKSRTATRPNESNPNNEYQDIAWWEKRGVSTSDIFDANGQLKPGWQRTARGYERTTSTGGKWGDHGGNFQNWFLSKVTQGLAPSGRALEAMGPELAKYGIKLGPRNAQGMIDTIILPDGSAWDVIEGATMDGGKRWQWIPAGGSGGTTTGGQGLPGVGIPGNQYNDPYSRMLEQLITSRIGQLTQPLFDPNRAMYEDAMKQRAAALGAAEPKYTQLLDYLQKRFEDLQGPGYTGAENEVIRTGALDPIENDRAAAKKRVIERLSARGLTPNSGVAQQALIEVDKAFDAMRGQNQTQLTANDLARREDRQQRAQGIGAQLVDIPQMRAREQLDVFSALEALSASARNEDQARAREAIAYGGSLNDMTMQRFQMAMQAAGMGGNPSSVLGGLTNMASLNNNAAMVNRASQQNLWSGLGSIAAILASSGR